VFFYLTIDREVPFLWEHWGWGREKERLNTHSHWYFRYLLEEGAGFLQWANKRFDIPDGEEYDPARCGAFADWLDEHKERLLEPHTDLRAEAEERLDSLIRWLRSGLQISA